MKKALIISGVVFVCLACMFGALKHFGPSDAIILTPEEEKAEEERLTASFEDADLSGFSTVTVTGNAISSDIFKNYKITMINLWVTSCSPCIEEMPDLGKLYHELPEGSTIISICLDTAGDKDAVKFAAKVMSDSKADFMTLVPDEALKGKLGDITTEYPTTIFVDSTGKTVGAPHFGGRTADDYKQAILDRMAILQGDSSEETSE